jgi:TP901 family phage tail tape measure protein
MADKKLRYYIIGNAKSLITATNKAGASLQRLGSKVKGIGQSLKGFQMFGALAGGAAIKLGADFDKNITKIDALVGASAEQLKQYSAAARSMAKETGISSKDTSNAMFFIASAGLEGEAAMNVLEASSKAAASGLGDVATIADLSTSAMNAFGISATDATDVLTAAVREGKLDAETLASAMGSVLPTASAMDVSFNEVGAAMAAMSRTGTDAASGATQLNSILSALLKTTPQAEEGLAKMGLSSAGLRQQIKDQGLLSVLDTLRIALDGNTDAAAQVFPNVRALRGVLDLTGKGAATTSEIFNELNASQGATAEAFDKTSKSASFQLQKALNGAKESFAEMGTVLLNTLLPVLQGLANTVKSVFSAFNNLAPAQQKIIAGLGLLALALPTLLTMLGTLMTTLAGLMSPATLIAAALAGIAYIIYKNWAEVAPVIVGLYNQFVDLYNSSKTLRVIIFGVGSAFKSVFIGARTIVLEFVNVFKTMWNLIKAFSEDGLEASFGDILSEGFDNAKQIAIDGAEEIGQEFNDGFTEALGSELEHKTVDQLNNTLTNVKNKVKGKVSDIFGNIMGGFGMAGDGGGRGIQTVGVGALAGGGASEQKGILLETLPVIESVQEKTSLLKETFDAVAGSAEVVGQGIKDAFLGAFDAMMAGENVFKALGQMLLDLIKKLVAAAMAAFVLSTLVKAIFPGAGGSDAKGLLQGMGSFKDLFTSFSGVKFAKGGIVSTPTMGLMGEYPGARSNPEVIAPLDKLQGMLAQTGGSGQVQVGGEFRIKGQDLVVALQRAERNRNRIK